MSFEMIDSEIVLPEEFTNESKGDQIICELPHVQPLSAKKSV
jgi:hypothetical protein